MHEVNYFFSMHINETCLWLYVYALYYTPAMEQRSVKSPTTSPLSSYTSLSSILPYFFKCLAALF